MTLTPGRSTHLRLDIGVPAVGEPAWAFGRKGGEISRGGKTKSTNVKLLATGCWGMSPTLDKPNSAMRTDGNGSLRASDFQLSGDMSERPFFRAPDEQGVTVSANVVPQGNYYLTRRIASGANWNQGLSADASAHPSPTLTEGNDVSQSRKAVTNVTYSMYQGWQLKIFLPASMSANSAQTCAGFSFNAPPSDTSGTTGEYFLQILYGGIAILSERVSDGASLPVMSWNKVYEWRFAPVTDNYGLNIIMTIVPHGEAQRGRTYLLFQSGPAETSVNVKADPFSGLSTPAGGQNSFSNIYAYNLKSSITSNSTDIPGVMRVDLPDNSKASVQVSQLQYPATGELVDLPFTIEKQPSTVANMRFYWNVWYPPALVGNTSLWMEGKLFDAVTNMECTQVSGDFQSKTYSINTRQPHYYAKFSYKSSADKNQMPVLWNFKVVKDAIFRTPTVNEIAIPDNTPLPKVRNINITGPERDPTHETGSCTIEDVGDNLSYPLRLRAGERGQVWTSYDVADPTKKSVLMDMYVSRSAATWKGYGSQAYPSPNWNSYDCSFVANWARLKETLTSQVYLLNGDPDPNNPGATTFTKVSDFVRALIATAGYSYTVGGGANNQIDVPDSPITFQGQTGSPGYVDSLQPVLDIATKMLQDYLGWYLAWDGNAGLSGMWRAIVPKPGFLAYTNLANFTMDSPGAKKHPFRPESYGTTNWVTPAAGGIVTAPIVKKSFVGYVVKPEGNSVFVTGTSSITPSTDGTYRVQNEMRNLKSYDSIWNDAGGAVGTADPTNADFSGRHVPIYVVMFGLQQAAVDIVCRRVFDVSCHAYDVFSFKAPLVLVTDPTDTLQANPRPLRYYDPVTITLNGVPTQCLVRNCNPNYRKDRFQWATYEVATPFF